MRILLTNDDGIDAPGLRKLEQALIKSGHEVFVVAPSGERSMNSHAMRFPSLDAVAKRDDSHFAIDGMPADTVYLAFTIPLIPTPDIVISGTNKGYNLSADVIFSGTYNAALEGAIYGAKAIAIAAENSIEIEKTYQKAASFITTNLDRFYPILNPSFVLNINVPENATEKWETATLGPIKHKEKNHLIDKEHAAFFASNTRTDFSVVNDGIIALTAVNVRPELNADAMLKLSKD